MAEELARCENSPSLEGEDQWTLSGERHRRGWEQELAVVSLLPSACRCTDDGANLEASGVAALGGDSQALSPSPGAGRGRPFPAQAGGQPIADAPEGRGWAFCDGP